MGNQDSPFWVSLVEQTSVEIWKLSRVDTAKLDVAPLTRKEEPERSFDSDRFRSEGRDRYALASSSFLLSPCKAQHRSHLEPQGTRLAPCVANGLSSDLMAGGSHHTAPSSHPWYPLAPGSHWLPYIDPTELLPEGIRRDPAQRGQSAGRDTESQPVSHSRDRRTGRRRRVTKRSLRLEIKHT